MDSGVLFYILYVTITNSQRQKKRMLIFIHFNTSRSFFYRDLLLATQEKMCVEPKQKYKYNAYRNAGNCPLLRKILGSLEIGDPRLKIF